MKLEVAGVKQSVTVEDTAAAVDTADATLSDSKTNGDINALPLNSRAVSTSPLAALATSASVTKDTQGNIAVGGATSAMVGFSVDGISTASVRSNGALLDAYPSSEGIQEMKVTAFNNNAEFHNLATSPSSQKAEPTGFTEACSNICRTTSWTRLFTISQPMLPNALIPSAAVWEAR